MTTTRDEPQMSFAEEPLDDDELEDLLDQWGDAKEALEPHARHFRGLNTTVKSFIERLETGHGTFRCGKWIITKKPSESREVAFERGGGDSIRIKPAQT